MMNTQTQIYRYQIATYAGLLLIIFAAAGLFGSWIVDHGPMIREWLLAPFTPVTGPVQRVSELLAGR